MGGSIGTWGGPYEFGVLCGGVGGIAMDWGGGGFPRCLGPSQLFSAIFTALG